MSFEGHRLRGRRDETPLSELPAWGLELMMGLYGPDTIKKACAEEQAVGVERRPLVPAARGTDSETRCVEKPVDVAHPEVQRPAADPGPLIVELEAMNALVRYLERKFRRH